MIIPDTDVEDSFDLQGCFVGKLPFDLDTQLAPRKPRLVEQPAPLTRRPPSENALRSIAATTTANTFVSAAICRRSRRSSFQTIRSHITATPNIFVTATTTAPTASPFGGFRDNRAPNPFIPPAIPVSLPRLVAPVARRLSAHSMDAFIDELYEQLLDPFIQETTCSIFE